MKKSIENAVGKKASFCLWGAPEPTIGRITSIKDDKIRLVFMTDDATWRRAVVPESALKGVRVLSDARYAQFVAGAEARAAAWRAASNDKASDEEE